MIDCQGARFEEAGTEKTGCIWEGTKILFDFIPGKACERKSFRAVDTVEMKDA